MNQLKHLIYSWNDQMYGVSLDVVLAVTGIEKMIKTNKPELKVSVFENRVLPVIDALAIFSIEECKMSKKSKIIVIKTSTAKFGLLVEEILGVENIRLEDIKPAGINERRFVVNDYKGVKLIEPNYFLTEKMMNLLSKASSLELNSILESETAFKAHWGDREFLMNEVKMELLNFILFANQKKLDKNYINRLTKIHNMIEKI